MSRYRPADRTLAGALLLLFLATLLLATGRGIFPDRPMSEARAQEADGGWSRVLVDGVGPLRAVFALSEEEAWAVGDGGQIWHYSVGTWRPEPSPTTVGLTGIFMVSPQQGWAVGSRSTYIGGKVWVWSDVLRYQNGAWRVEAQFPDLYLRGLYFTSADEGWLAGGTAVVHYRAGGWETTLLPSVNTTAISMANATEGWAVGNGILHYRDGTWQVEMTEEQIWGDWCRGERVGRLASVYVVSVGDVWAVGGCGFGTPDTDQPIIYHRTAAGWQRVPNPAVWGDELLALAMSGGTGWAVGKRGSLLRYRDGRWQFPPLGTYQPNAIHPLVASISMASPDRGWMVGQDWPSGLIMRYDPVRGFVLASARSSALLAPGQAADFALTVQGIGGFTSPVTLAAGGLPSGTVAAFSSNPVTPTAALTLTLTTATDTPSGTYPLAVTASGQDITYTRAITLVVASPLHQRFLPWVVGGGWAGGW